MKFLHIFIQKHTLFPFKNIASFPIGCIYTWFSDAKPHNLKKKSIIVILKLKKIIKDEYLNVLCISS